MGGLDWEDIHHFTALAQRLSVADAARELGASQVTVTRRVKALERALGATLFLRGRGGYRLTTAGVELLRAARPAREQLEHGARQVADRDARGEGRVRVATTELGANWILIPHLGLLHARAPGVALDIAATPRHANLLQEAEMLALRFRRPEAGPYRVRRLGEVRFGLYRRAGAEDGAHRIAAPDRAYVGWTDDAEHPAMAGWLRRLHEGAAPTSATTGFEGHLKAALHGLGAAALPAFIGERQPELIRLDTGADPFSLEAWLVIPEQRARGDRVRTVARFITEAFRRAVVGGPV